MNKKRILSILKHSVLTFWLILVLFPIIYTIASSFKTNTELLAHPERVFPHNPTLDNYKLAWNSGSFSIKNMLFNSTYFTLASVIITLFISSMCGYVFARGRFRGKNLIFTIFASLLFVHLGSITMYPFFEILDFLHFPKSLPALLFIRCFALPIANVYLVRGFIYSMPIAIDEAAKIDGCSFARIFFSITIHMLKPILATIAILTFQGTWNEYLMPAIFTMTRPEQKTLIVGVVTLKSTGEAAAAWNLMLAGSTVALIPVLIAYACANNFFVEGIANGAVKG